MKKSTIAALAGIGAAVGGAIALFTYAKKHPQRDKDELIRTDAKKIAEASNSIKKNLADFKKQLKRSKPKFQQIGKDIQKADQELQLELNKLADQINQLNNKKED